jgi:hypothetical protein
MSSVNIGVVFIRWHTRRWVYSSKREGNKTNPLTFSDVDMTIDLEIDSKHVESYLTIHTNGVYTCDGYVIDSHWLQTSVYANSHTVHSESTFEQANRLDIGPSHRRKCFVLQTIRWVQFVFLLTPLINKKETYSRRILNMNDTFTTKWISIIVFKKIVFEFIFSSVHTWWWTAMFVHKRIVINVKTSTELVNSFLNWWVWQWHHIYVRTCLTRWLSTKWDM